MLKHTNKLTNKQTNEKKETNKINKQKLTNEQTIKKQTKNQTNILTFRTTNLQSTEKQNNAKKFK